MNTNRPSADGVTIRRIEAEDDAAIASIIRETLTELGCTGPGFALHDPEVAAMTANYQGADRGYFVVEVDGVVLGGGGFAPLDGAASGHRIAELRKMYFRPALRGLGAGGQLLSLILDAMRQAGFREAYLETTTRMEAARRLYRRFGFVEIDVALGATGHHACDRFFRLQLAPTTEGRELI